MVPSRCLEFLEKRIICYSYRKSFLDLSQPALGWLKVCYDVDKHLSLPSLYGYRLAIGYFRGG